MHTVHGLNKRKHILCSGECLKNPCFFLCVWLSPIISFVSLSPFQSLIHPSCHPLFGLLFFYIPFISFTTPPIYSSFFLSLLSLCAPSYLFLALFSLTVALPIPLPLIYDISLPQSQIIPSLWNWKISASPSKREIILPD